MARRSSQAPGTRPSASGTRFPSARVAIRVAKADLTTVGSSDDTRDICDLVWWTFFASCHDRLFRLCSFSRLVDPCFALTIFHTPQRIFVLGTAISNVRQPSPSPPPTSHLYPLPQISLTRHRHILYNTHHARVDTPLHLQIYLTVSQTHQSSSRFVFHSLFPVRSVRFALIHSLPSPCSRLCLSFPLLLSTF
jgi:hypothetical protein